MANQEILISNNYINIQNNGIENSFTPEMATIISNLAYYGYMLNVSAYKALSTCTKTEIEELWSEIEPILQEITGTNRNMAEYVVYKNFPKEVIDMSAAKQFFDQIFLYMGIVTYDDVRENPKQRESLDEFSNLKVLTLADDNTTKEIVHNLISQPTRWNDKQNSWVRSLIGGKEINVDDYGFKENGISLAALKFNKSSIQISTATDVLRLTAALSDQDMSLRSKVVLRSFKRSERRSLLSMLNDCNNLKDDMAERPELFKRLMTKLRPNDYKFSNVTAAYDDLYNKRLKTFLAKIEKIKHNESVLDLLVKRPGVFLRNFHLFYSYHHEKTVNKFLPILPNFNNTQLVKLRGYLKTINSRKTLMYPPKSNWGKAQIEDNMKLKIKKEHIAIIDKEIGRILSERLEKFFGGGADLSPELEKVKLQTNDQKLAAYGRGTVFDIPDDVSFIRSASYWETKVDEENPHSNVWYDNGWNFFDDDWQSINTLSWSTQKSLGDAAVFSGDPTSGTNDNKGCQLIDIYIDKLLAQGIRYAVWNILCYSGIPFSGSDVLATLQWGESCQKGELYEPSRAQMVFPLKSDNDTSYVAYVDLKTRKLVYMDAPLRGRVHNANANEGILSEIMPSYVEYLDSLPSVYDLVKDVKKGNTPLVYSDKDVSLTGDAYVFKPSNPDNKFKNISVEEMLSL